MIEVHGPDSWDLRQASELATEPALLNRLANTIFHRLWGQAKEGASYDKDLWCALQNTLNKLNVMV